MLALVGTAARVPTAPASSVSSATQTSLQVSLATASVEPISGVIGYDILRGLTSSQLTRIATAVSPSAFPYTDSSLVPGTTYYYALQGIDGSPNAYRSARSAIASGSTAPATSGGGGTGNYTQVFSVASGGWPAPLAAGTFSVNYSAGYNVDSSGYLCPGYTLSGHCAGAVAYIHIQDISQGFTTTFDFDIRAISGSPSAPAIASATFVINNYVANPCIYFQANSPWKSYADANQGGYGGYYPPPGALPALLNSIGVKFADMGCVNGQSLAFDAASGVAGQMGVYGNGGPLNAQLPSTDMTTAGINLYAANNRLYRGTVVYDATLKLLTMVLLDTVTNAQFRKTVGVDVAAVIGGNVGYVSLNVGIGPNVFTQYFFHDWTFGTGLLARLASPSISPAPGQYSGTQLISLSGPSGSTLYYTTNGLEPTSSSTKYTGPFAISASSVIKSIAIQSTFTDSLVITSSYQIGTSLLVNQPGGFTGAPMICNGAASILSSGGAVQLLPYGGTPGSGETNTSPGFAGSAFWGAPLPVNKFTWNFQIQFPGGSEGGGSNGMTACIQNQNAMTTSANYQWASGGIDSVANSNGFGYSGNTSGQNSGLLNSLAIVFDFVNNGTGMYTGGAPLSGSAVSFTGGVSLASEHLFNCTLAYDGSNLTLSMTDTVNAGTFSHTWPGVNIASIVNGETAFFGFTGGTAFYNSNQLVKSMTLSSP